MQPGPIEHKDAFDLMRPQGTTDEQCGQMLVMPIELPDGSPVAVLSRWTLTDAEREALANGADLYVNLCCVNRIPPMLPIVAETEADAIAVAEGSVGLLYAGN